MEKKAKIRAKLWEKFRNSCHKAVVLGYNTMMKKELTYKEWEEEDISAVLYEEMRKLSFIKTKQISISTEIRLYDEAILTVFFDMILAKIIYF